MTALHIMIAIQRADADGFTHFRDMLIELLKRQLSVCDGGKP